MVNITSNNPKTFFRKQIHNKIHFVGFLNEARDDVAIAKRKIIQISLHFLKYLFIQLKVKVYLSLINFTWKAPLNLKSIKYKSKNIKIFLTFWLAEGKHIFNAGNFGTFFFS